jgi:cellulose synthase operon protein C
MLRQSLALSCITLATVGMLGLAGCRGSGNSDVDLLASAKQYVEKKDHRAATIQLKNILRTNPDSMDARLLLAKALLQAGDPAAAIVELNKAQELKAAEALVFPDMARAMLMMGDHLKVIDQFAAVRLKDPDSAADLLTSVATAYGIRRENDNAREAVAAALATKPGFSPATLVLAQLLATDGKAPEAVALLDKTLAADPSDEPAGVLRAEMLWRYIKDTDAAAKGYLAVLEKKPDSLGAHTALITLYNGLGKKEESKTQFAALKKALPQHPETLFYEAQNAFASQDYKTARDISDKLLKLMPQNVRLLELAGAVEYRSGQYSQAETLLTQAIKISPGQVLARQLLAQTYVRMNQATKALEVLQPLTSGKEPDANSLAIAGEAHLLLGETKQSDAAFQAAAKADPNNTRIRTTAAAMQANRGDTAALADLANIAAADTGPRADFALVSARMRAGDAAGALKAIEGLEKKMPDRAVPLGLRGQVLLGQRDVAGARKAFDAALAKEPTYFPAIVSLASMDLSEGKPDVARQRYEAFIKANPTNYQALLSLSELNARTGSPVAEVIKLSREAVRISPQEPTPRMVLIEQLISSGDTKAALVLAQESAVVLPNNLDIAESLGRAQLASGDAQQAISSFKKVGALLPKNARVQVRLAEAFLARKDYAASTAALKKALEIDPTYAPAMRGMVMVAVADKRPDDAIKVARELQKAATKDATGYIFEGEVELSRKNYDAAIAAYTTALQRVKSTEHAIKLHAAMQAGGKKAEAERLAGDWQKDNPKDAGFRFYLGDMAMSRGDDAGAEALYRSVMALQPNNALAMNNVAWLLLKQKKPGATELAEKANKLLADRAPLLDTLALAQAADNQIAKAVETQKRAVAVDPENPSLKLALARLYVKQGEKAFARAELETLSKLGDKFQGQAEVAAMLKAL